MRAHGTAPGAGTPETVGDENCREKKNNSSNPNDGNALLDRLVFLFDGYSKAHGSYDLSGEKDARGKAKGRASTVKTGGATAALWRAHLKGQGKGIGVIPLRDDDTVVWGCIDVDEYRGLDHGQLEKKINGEKLPLVVCRSKSGGAHLFLFLKEPTPAVNVVDVLENWAAGLGYPGIEIFPKQTSRANEDDVGNWLNMPYYNTKDTNRYGIRDGQPISLGDFIEHAESKRSDDLSRLELKAHSKKGTQKTKRPPDGRNDALFKRGCALRRIGYDEAQLRDELLELDQEADVGLHDNFEYGPVGQREVLGIVRSIVKRYPAGSKLVMSLSVDHAVIRAGGEVVILRELIHPETGQQTEVFTTRGKLREWFANRLVRVSKKLKMNPVDLWVQSKYRREYSDGVVFDPSNSAPETAYNIWKGWAVKPNTSTSCNLFINHVRDVICSGDEAIFSWVMDWLADLIQNPANKPGTALVLRSGEGTGKGQTVQYLSRLLGRHYLHLADQNRLTGRFNDHLKGGLLFFADEAFFGGDKSVDGKLKALITEPTFLVEVKHGPVIPIKNPGRIIMSSNNDWVVPTGADARRYCVLDMNSNRVGDFEYFSALIDESENGGDGALLHYLQCREIKSNLRVPPKTESLLDQKHLSMESHMAWWYECLSCGCIDEVDENGWPHRKPKKYVYAAYQMHCQAVKTRYPKSPEGIGKFLKGKLGYSDTKAPITVREQDGEEREKWVSWYLFPDLATCRSDFEKILQQDVPWPDVDPDEDMPF